MIITNKSVEEFKAHLINEEKSKSTLENYIRSLRLFMKWLKKSQVDKQKVIEYKAHLIEKYKISTANAAISALNSFFDFHELINLKVKTFKIQKEIFYSESRELTKTEYKRLLFAASQKKNQRLYFLMQTICSTGIRVSELKFITAESVKNKYAEVRCKGKTRKVILSDKLCSLLKNYIKSNNIKTGSIFVTRAGKPINRTNIWREMCNLCKSANVSKKKVFPHNLRHLFARTYYSIKKDIVRLADILGHTNINTTRIYTMESGAVHRIQIQKLGLTDDFYIKK